jgi:hypothetical protein
MPPLKQYLSQLVGSDLGRRSRVHVTVRLGFNTDIPVSKWDEYRANAEECQRIAGISRNPDEMAIRQQMAQRWLGMIPKEESLKSEQAQTKSEK